MTKYCIVSDLHLKYKWLIPFIEKNVDYFAGWIFLGDYFHQFNDNAAKNEEMAVFLKDVLFKLPNSIFLQGNHDWTHRYSVNHKVNSITYCPGWSEEKDIAINNILNKDDWTRLKDYHLLDGWLLSHAGFAPSIFTHPTKGFRLEYVDSELERAYDNLKWNKWHPAFYIGYGRGGNKPFGGHLWQDFDTELIPLKDQKQIVGHSIHPHPDCKFFNPYYSSNIQVKQFGPHIDQTNNSLAICLDTNCRYFGMLDDGYFSVGFVEEWI